MKKCLFIITLILLFVNFSAKADEGMWLPVLIKQLNIDDMRAKGFKLDAEDIYSINKACIKDAVMIFGGGCTAELISKDGLLLTNHHCGYPQIQKHSSLEHDYLTDGFWAGSRKEELPNPGLSVTFLRSMKEVSKEILSGVDESKSESDRALIIKVNTEKLVSEATKGTNYIAQVKSFFNDNVYYLLIEEKFNDVRLVGCPPSAIGKFGGDTDNWVWPRHGADFSMFRIYANKDNQSAKYASDNVPYHPRYSLPISLGGIQEGDFTFVLGYPGSTQEYAPALQLEMLTQTVYPQLIDIRTKKLNIINSSMSQSAKVRIQYSAKAASISNAWKKWIGEIKGLEKLDAINKKRSFERQFQTWADNKSKNINYQHILSEYETLYPSYEKFYLPQVYYREITGSNGMEFVSFIGKLTQQLDLAVEKNTLNDSIWDQLDKQTTQFFKDYDKTTDSKLTSMILTQVKEVIDPYFLPKVLSKNKAENLCNRVFKSEYINAFSIKDFKNNPKDFLKKLKTDPAYNLYKDFDDTYNTKIKDKFKSYSNQKKLLDRTYMKALMEFEKEKKFYPDANFTMRLAYGKVAGYQVKDAICYSSQTFLKGVMEKDDPTIYDYKVPSRLKELYLKKDFGEYAQNGQMPVCFVATNHTTGGNSGSPVMNSRGELIGINFDRAWEGVMSDLMYNPNQCRNISVDIRYILFLVDKYAGASYLLNEMDLRRPNAQ